MRLAPFAVAAALLTLPASADAAPVPGAHYTGTTDQNYPISFDVSPDGTSLTNVVTTVNGSCGQQYSSNSTFLFPIAGNTISGDDPDTFPYLKMRGTFSSAQQASGTLSAYHPGSGGPLYCNALEREWSASTTSVAPGSGGGGGGGGSTGGGETGGGSTGGGETGGGLGAGAPAITFAFPRGVLLRPSLKNGFVVGVGVDRPASISGRLTLGRSAARKYKLGKRAVVVSRSKESNGGADSGLEFTFKKAIRKKLLKAKKLSFKLDVIATSTDGSRATGSRTITLR